MNTLERFDDLLQKQQAGQLGDRETAELRDLMKSTPEALDRYLDLCQLEEAFACADQQQACEPVVLSANRGGTRHALRPLTLWTVVAAILIVVGVAVSQQGSAPNIKSLAMSQATMPSKDSTVSDDAPTGSDTDDPVRQSPNPWKVINSTGSMNHPSLSAMSVPQVASVGTRRIEFNRDIRPILSETCFHCHGPDEQGRRADLRLDTLEGATEDLGGYQAIVPGGLVDSEAWARIISDDPDLLMPPPESHLELSGDQKTLLKRWIQEGAQYQGHWAFIPPRKPAVPDVNFADESGQTKWVRGAIDSFVAARLAENGLSPSREADSRTLLRRLTFDLTGLPPTVQESRQFVDDYQQRGEVAYQDLVTRLLQSPHFGERMAVPWLDQARYADTNGYSIDGGRDMWLWRDWVIQAYNDNMPFDQFVTEQLAGDLLPDASDGQRIATGFNRNHMITHEGGTIPEENLTNYVADRVKTTGEVFLGLTMGCAQCHDHKYDPISQEEYYQFFAFFNELEDRGLDGNAGINAGPKMLANTVLRSDELETIEAEIAAIEQELTSTTTDGFPAWLDTERKRELARGDRFRFPEAKLLDVSSPNRPGPFEFHPDGTVTVSQPSRGLNGFSHSLLLGHSEENTGEQNAGEQKPVDLVTGVRIEFVPESHGEREDADDTSLVLTPFDEGVPKVTTVLISATSQPADQVDFHSQLEFSHATASSSAAGHDPMSVLDERNLQWWEPAKPDMRQHLTLTFDQPVDPAETPYLSVLVFFGTNQSLPYHWRVRPLCGNDPDRRWSEAVAASIAENPSQWDDEAREKVWTVFRESAPSLEPLRVRLANLRERRGVLTQKHSAMVMNTAKKPRETFVLERGQYDSPTRRVTPQTPKALPPLSVSASPSADSSEPIAENAVGNPTRLDLARWLTDPEHPLTARVAVNRIWAMLFGTGLVATSADFGSQGEYPSHPELLDHLARHFTASGWNQKDLIREIVSSATYRQQSSATAEQLELDPKNRLLARGPRFRLPAEFIRDSALAVSGLLVPRVGGPSVHPYQPAGLWKEVSHFGSTPATKQVFVQDHGEKLYRRSLYTIVKRTSPHPAMAAFDAPNREMCTVDRGVTNTPLQALVTLNDPQYAEAARVLAASLLQDDSVADDRSRLRLAFEQVVCRPPSDAESTAVEQFLTCQLTRYQAAPADARRVVAVGESPVAKDLDAIQQAAWTQVAALLMNLSEALTRS